MSEAPYNNFLMSTVGQRKRASSKTYPKMIAVQRHVYSVTTDFFEVSSINDANSLVVMSITDTSRVQEQDSSWVKESCWFP